MSKYNLKIEDVSVEAVFNKLGGVTGARRLLSGELELVEVTRPWREEDGVVYFSVTSDGTTGPEWIERLKGRGIHLSDWAKDLLRSKDFQTTTGVTTEIAVLKGDLFNDDNRVMSKIRSEANKRKLTPPNAEVACLIREKFPDKQIEAMELWWIVVMHEPIQDSDGVPNLLGASRYGGGSWLFARCVRPGYGWSRAGGFAFALSQVSS